MKTPLTLQEKAVQVAAEEKYNAEQDTRIANFRALVPKRMALLTSLAEQVGVTVKLKLTEKGPEIHFFIKDPNHNFSETLTYESDEWDIEWMEMKVQEIKEEQDAREARRNLAKTAFSKLSDEEKAALKEFIHYLR